MDEVRKKLLSVAIGAICGIAAVLLIAALFSFIIVKSESVNYSLLIPFGIVAACIGIYFGKDKRKCRYAYRNGKWCSDVCFAAGGRCSYRGDARSCQFIKACTYGFIGSNRRSGRCQREKKKKTSDLIICWFVNDVLHIF